jgi:hypothetical protein
MSDREMLLEALRKIAIIGLQTKSYIEVPDFKEAVDEALEIIKTYNQ